MLGFSRTRRCIEGGTGRGAGTALATFSPRVGFITGVLALSIGCPMQSQPFDPSQDNDPGQGDDSSNPGDGNDVDDTNPGEWTATGLEEVGHADLGGGDARDVVVQDGYAYVANGANGVAVVDVSNPRSPNPVATIPTAINNESENGPQDGGEARAIAIADGHLYIADYLRGLVVVSVSGTHSPATPGDCSAPRDERDSRGCRFRETSGRASGVAVANGYVFIADGTSTSTDEIIGLVVVRLLAPGDPGPRRPLSDEQADPTRWTWNVGDARDVAVHGTHALVTTAVGVVAVDVSSPTSTSPSQQSPNDWSGRGMGVAIRDTTAIVAAGARGAALFDLSSPMSPQLLTEIDLRFVAIDVATHDDWVLIAAEGTGVGVVDITDPASPKGPDARDTAGKAQGIAVDGDYIYVADGFNGLVVFEIEP